MAEQELSRNPKQIRNRLRRGTNPARDLAMLHEADSYHKPLAEWDLEELGRGYPRDSKGSFTGRRTPPWLVGPLQLEREKRLKQGVYNGLMAHADTAMKVLGQLVSDPETSASVRADIGKFIYEQLHGKATAQVQVDGKMDHTMQILASAIVLDDGLPQGHLGAIEGELVEDDEEDPDADRPWMGPERL